MKIPMWISLRDRMFHLRVEYAPTQIYKKVFWSEVKREQIVYLQGKAHGRPHMYGPFEVAELKNRVLKNPNGRRFIHFPEELHIKI